MLQLVAQMGKSWGVASERDGHEGRDSPRNAHGAGLREDNVGGLVIAHNPDPSHEQCHADEAIVDETARMQAQERMSCSLQLLRPNPLTWQTTERGRSD